MSGGKARGGTTGRTRGGAARQKQQTPKRGEVVEQTLLPESRGVRGKSKAGRYVFLDSKKINTDHFLDVVRE